MSLYTLSALACLLACTLPLTLAAPLVVFGDSWGTYGEASLKKVFTDKYGIEFANYAVGGSTAAEWALVPNTLRDKVRLNPDAKWVWLTIGGNDGAQGLAAGKSIQEVVKEVTAHTHTFLNPLFNDSKTIDVVQFGYDILTFNKGLTCPIFGEAVFTHCHGNITCVNTDFINLQYAYVEPLDQVYPQHHSVNLLGTLQAAGGIPGASIGHPNMAYYSPNDLMLDNCIHPNDKGFVDIFEAFYNLYFKAQWEASAEF